MSIIENDLIFVKDINAFLDLLPIDQTPISGQITTLEDWKKKRVLRNTRYIGLFFAVIEFIFLRFLPKFKLLKVVYSLFDFNSNKYISSAEILGRFIYCGFEIIEFNPGFGKHNFVIRRMSESAKDSVQTGFLIKLKRLGKNGKTIFVFKLRTMHPYSEYLHNYLINKHGFNEKGKIKNDFRTTKYGKLLRKVWIDEIPQFFNLLKGDLKLVGIRPISFTYFESLPEEFKEIRIKHKPGCIPPYVSLNMQSNVSEVIEAEKIYLNEQNSKKFVDLKYFFLALYNILIKNKRSS